VELAAFDFQAAAGVRPHVVETVTINEDPEFTQGQQGTLHIFSSVAGVGAHASSEALGSNGYSGIPVSAQFSLQYGLGGHSIFGFSSGDHIANSSNAGNMGTGRHFHSSHISMAALSGDEQVEARASMVAHREKELSNDGPQQTQQPPNSPSPDPTTTEKYRKNEDSKSEKDDERNNLNILEDSATAAPHPSHWDECEAFGNIDEEAFEKDLQEEIPNSEKEVVNSPRCFEESETTKLLSHLKESANSRTKLTVNELLKKAKEEWHPITENSKEDPEDRTALPPPKDIDMAVKPLSKQDFRSQSDGPIRKMRVRSNCTGRSLSPPPPIL
jgi:hypothetical protein